MKKFLLSAVLSACMTVSAWAGVSCSLPVTLTNGTLADANQVMSDFNALVTCLTNAAAAGANSDITSLSGITTPIPAAEGGSSAYIGGTSTGTANAQIVASPTPNGFTLTSGYRVYFIAGFTNTGTMTLNVNGTGNKNVFRQTPTGPVALIGSEVVSGTLTMVIYDGTQYELVNNQEQHGGVGPQATLASAATTDLGTTANHNIQITGTTTITSFGSSAVSQYPLYFLNFSGALTITNNANISIPGATNIITAAGDTAIVMYQGGGVWKVLVYTTSTSLPSAGSVFIGSNATGGVNAQSVATTTPSNFSLTAGYRVLFFPSGTNTGAMTLNVNGTGAKNVFRMSPSGAQALTGGEVVASNLVEAVYDGTQYELVTVHNQFGGFGLLTSIASAATTDLGTIPSHNINITGTTTITSLGSSASATFPLYRLTFAGALTLTQNATSLILPGAANITTTANDTAWALYLGGGNWQIINYTVNSQLTSVFIGATSSGTNSQVVATTTPSNFALTTGFRVVFPVGTSTTAAATLNVNGTGAKNIFRMSPSGPQALTGGELIAGNIADVVYDGTQYELVSVHNQFGGFGLLTNLASAATTDFGTIPSHNINITGTTTITSFGSSASTTFPYYRFTIGNAATPLLTNAASLILPGSANIQSAAGDTGEAIYLGSGNWQVTQYTPASGTAVINQSNLCGATNLNITNNGSTPNSIINLKADVATMLNSSNTSILVTSVSLSAINITTGNVSSTANGMDGEAPGTNNWLNVFLISNGTTTAGLVSLASGNNLAPTMPAGYTYKCRLGAMKVDGSGNLYRSIQNGALFQWQVTASTNTTTPQNIEASGSSVGSNCGTATPTWAAVTIRGASGAAVWVPPTATYIYLVGNTNATAGDVSEAAPNAAWGGYTPTTTIPAFTVVSAAAVVNVGQGGFALEANTIQVCTIAASLWTTGYKDNVNAN